ncbi:mediator of RNA polymerase II transcription subunit 24 [Trypanosoma theileri]|uniref:Mediator of RNA polymerase II transcription subunit 24 n=1 Tax=Trypanosoma theileri TaxID=67003 RepID=A0A1X0NRY3_9TRYP|nr:mediator of RNA polymerase II transcription subunit 24 [Trypanosoma theileri]ORC87447.1 mediator of RNA polymerase II transcription subunit 24 [Trypanosoma theileri]
MSCLCNCQEAESVVSPRRGGGNSMRPVSADGSSNKAHAPPVSARQWVEVTMMCLQNKTVPLRRLLTMLEDTAQALLDEDASKREKAESRAAAAMSVPGVSVLPGDDGVSLEFSTPETTSLGQPAAVDVTPRRWLATRFLLLGSQLGLNRGSPSSLRNAVRLAELAVDTHYCATTTTHLAWACYCLGRHMQDSGKNSRLEKMSRDLTLETSEVILKRSMSLPTDVVLLTKLVWLMALLGETQQAFSVVPRLIDENRAEVKALILLSLLYSSTGEYHKALEVAYHMEQLYPQNIVGGLLLIMLRYASGEIKYQKQESVEELLTVLIARIQSVAQYTSGGINVDDLIAVPDIATMAVADGVWSTRSEGRSQVAGHWALLAYVALETGCDTIAQLAVEAGMEYISEDKEEHRQSFADLICCDSRIKINKIEKLVEMVHIRPKTANDIDGGGTAAAAVTELQEMEDERLIQQQQGLLDQSEVLSLRTMLGKALEVSSAHAEAHLLLGRLYLLEALKADQSQQLHATRLVEAAHYFESAIRCSSTLTEAYEGMGRVRESQGAMEMSLSFLSSAAELAYRQPVIPFERFTYLL